MLHGNTCFVNHVNCTGDVKARIIKATTQVDTGTLFSNHIKTNYLTSYKNLTVGNNLYVDGAANITKTLGVQGKLNAHSDLHVEGQSVLKHGDVITLGPQFEKLGLLIVEGSMGNYSSTSVVKPKNNNQGWGERWIIKKTVPRTKVTQPKNMNML